MKKIFLLILAALAGLGAHAKTIYLNTGGASLWNQADAVFFVHSWKGETENPTDLQMTHTDGDIFEVSVPDENDKILFVRMPNGSTSLNWDNLWNKTEDQTIANGNNMFTITGWRENSVFCDGSWSVYNAQGGETVKIVPSDNSAEITWPVVIDAASYELVIRNKDGKVICTLVFNDKGQLVSININTPARDRSDMPEHVEAESFSFTVTGLKEGTTYNYTLTAKDSGGNTIDTKTGSFRTAGEEAVTIYLTVLSADEKMGTVTGGGEYEEGSEITIEALPKSGYRFVRWSDGSTDNPHKVMLTKSRILIAYFEEIPNALDDTQAEIYAPRKVMRDGVMYIVMPDGTLYNANGVIVK